MLKQTEIKVSLCKKIWYPSTNKIKKRWLHCKKSIEFAEYNLLPVLEAEVKLSNIVDQHDNFKLQPNYARTKRLWAKSNGVELTMLPVLPKALDLNDFIQKSHVLTDERIDIS